MLTVLVRALAVIIPFAVGTAAGILVGRALPRPDGAAMVAWWAAVIAAAIAGMLASEVLARRLLPLSALLRLTFAFPDHAPSRLRVALRATNVRKMQARIASAEHRRLPPSERAAELIALAAALNAHDRRTRGHSERVQALTRLVTEQMNLEEGERERIAWAAFLHDIGKLEVPSSLLNKAGPPSRSEWVVLRKHPEMGERLAEPLEPWLGDAVGAIGQHHERFDGTGYPRGLSGDDISLAGRIVSVTDAFETITAVRSYKRPNAFADARAEITRCAGTHFDPNVVRSLLEVSLGRLRWVIGVASWVAFVPLLGSIPRARASMGQPALAGAGSALAGAAVAGLIVGGGPASIGGVPPTAGAGTDAGGAGPAPAATADSVEDGAAALSDPAAAGNPLGHQPAAGTRPGPGTEEPGDPAVEVIVRAARKRITAGPGGAMVEATGDDGGPSVSVHTPGADLEAP